MTPPGLHAGHHAGPGHHATRPASGAPGFGGALDGHWGGGKVCFNLQYLEKGFDENDTPFAVSGYAHEVAPLLGLSTRAYFASEPFRSRFEKRPKRGHFCNKSSISSVQKAKYAHCSCTGTCITCHCTTRCFTTVQGSTHAPQGQQKARYSRPIADQLGLREISWEGAAQIEAVPSPGTEPGEGRKEVTCNQTLRWLSLHTLKQQAHQCTVDCSSEKQVGSKCDHRLQVSLQQLKWLLIPALSIDFMGAKNWSDGVRQALSRLLTRQGDGGQGQMMQQGMTPGYWHLVVGPSFWLCEDFWFISFWF